MLPVLVNQESARHKGDLREWARPGETQRRGQGREGRDEAPIGARELRQIPPRAHEPPVVARGGVLGLQQQHALADAGFREAGAQLLGTAKARMPEHIRRELPEAEPMQLLAQPNSALPSPAPAVRA